MTTEEFQTCKHALNYSFVDLARLLRLPDKHGERTVRRWYHGEVPVPGPAAVAVEAMMRGFRPAIKPPVHAQRKAAKKSAEDAIRDLI